MIGRIASGKTVVASHLQDEYGGRIIRFSDALRDVLDRLHLENTRTNLQDLGVALRGTFGDGILAQAVRKEVESCGDDVIVVDGIRYQDEFDMAKALGAKIIFVDAPQEARYGRVVGRGTRGEAHISLEEFKASELKPTEKEIDSLGAKADYVVENTGSIEELKGRIDEIMGVGGLT